LDVVEGIRWRLGYETSSYAESSVVRVS